MGPSGAKEIIFTGSRFDAREASALGLLNRVVAPEEFDAAVEEYATQFAENAPLTVRASNRIVTEALEDPERCDLALCACLVVECYESEDYVEDRRAFMEKRRPQFRGRWPSVDSGPTWLDIHRSASSCFGAGGNPEAHLQVVDLPERDRPIVLKPPDHDPWMNPDSARKRGYGCPVMSRLSGHSGRP